MRRPIIFVLLAGFAALVAALVVYSALKRREAEVQQAIVQSVNIVVASHELGIGSKLDPASVKTVRWSRDAIPPGSYTDPAAVLNQYTKTSFVENEPIVADRLFGGVKNAGILPLLIPEGMRALSVPVDEVSDIAGFVLPHTHVDVLVSLTNGGQPLSKIVLQDVEVLAIAQDIEGGKDNAQIVHVVTVLVTPDQAERLTLASHEGGLRLAMRNYDDKKVISTGGIDVAQLLGAQPAAVPVIGPQHLAATPRPKPVTVEVMRNGRSSEAVSFVRTGSHGGDASMEQAPADNDGSPGGGGSTAADRPDKFAAVGGGFKAEAVNSTSRMPAARTSLASADQPGSPMKSTPGFASPGSPEQVLLGTPADAASAVPAALAAAATGYSGPHSKTIDVP